MGIIKQVAKSIVFTVAVLAAVGGFLHLAEEFKKTGVSKQVMVGSIITQTNLFPSFMALVDSKNSSVEIIMGTNYGGQVKAYQNLRNVIRNSNKTVMVTCKTFCASASAMLLYTGDLVKVYKDSNILFHAMRYPDPYGQQEYRVPTWDLLETEMDKAIFKVSLMVLARTRTQVTTKEYFSMLSGNDIILSGKEVCSRNKTVVDNKIFCIFKGNKDNEQLSGDLF